MYNFSNVFSRVSLVLLHCVSFQFLQCLSSVSPVCFSTVLPSVCFSSVFLVCLKCFWCVSLVCFCMVLCFCIVFRGRVDLSIHQARGSFSSIPIQDRDTGWSEWIVHE